MIGFTVSVVVVVLMNIPMCVADVSCPSFTTRIALTQQSATLKFWLPETCTREDSSLTLVVVSVKDHSPDAVAEDVCQILSSDWAKRPASQCILDVKSQEYSVTRKFGPTPRDEVVILTAQFARQRPTVNEVVLQLPGLLTPTVSTYTTLDRKPSTTKKPEVGVSSQGGAGNTAVEITTRTVESPKAGDADSDPVKPTKTASEEEASNPATSEDNTSFMQTPAFGFVLMGAVMAVILILLVVLLLKVKGSPLLARRRARNSLVIPDNYEHPRGSHNYERPIHRRGIQQQPLPPPPPPSNPADVNRDSLPDPNYSVIDDVMVDKGQYEVPVPVTPERVGSTQAETNV